MVPFKTRTDIIKKKNNHQQFAPQIWHLSWRALSDASDMSQATHGYTWKLVSPILPPCEHQKCTHPITSLNQGFLCISICLYKFIIRWSSDDLYLFSSSLPADLTGADHSTIKPAIWGRYTGAETSMGWAKNRLSSGRKFHGMRLKWLTNQVHII